MSNRMSNRSYVAVLCVLGLISLMYSAMALFIHFNTDTSAEVPDSAPVAFELSDADLTFGSANEGRVSDPETGCSMNLTYQDDLASAIVTNESVDDGCTVELSVGLGSGIFTAYDNPDQSATIARGTGWSVDGYAVRLCDEIGECLVVHILPQLGPPPLMPSATTPQAPPAVPYTSPAGQDGGGELVPA